MSSTSNTWINAIIGAVVTVVTSFLVLSPILGGAVAGYLESAETDAGLRVGALSGLLATIPFVGFVLLGFGLYAGFSPSVGGPPIGAFALFFAVAGAAVAFTVGLSAAGGYLGSYLKRAEVL
ncbi:DUF5518 domain-containing protein [Haloferacaceae archaeon DSL9]